MTEAAGESPKNVKNRQKSLISSAAGMAAGTFLSRILGFLRDVVLVGLFPRIVTDAFVFGFRIPNFFRRVMGEGALAVSFLPTYMDLKINCPEEAKKLKNIVFSFLFLTSAILSLLGILFMEQVVDFLLWLSDTHDFTGEPRRMSIQMGRWMFCYLFLVVQFAYFMSVLNAEKKFWLAGFAPALFNLGFLILAFTPNAWMGFTGQQLALGVLLGGILQAGALALYYLKNFEPLSYCFELSFKPFKKVLVATLPGIMGVGVLQLISIINISLCAYVGAGALTSIYLADRILELPQSLIAVSIGTVMLPSLSELWVKDRKAFDQTLAKSLRLYLFFAIPSALGLYFLALPISQLLFQRGQTSFSDVLTVASLVKIYSVLLIVSGLSKILLPAYYSFKNTWFPALLAVFIVAFHFVFGSYMVKAWGIEGIVTSTLVSGLLNFIFLVVGLKIFIKRLYILGLLKDLVQFLAPALSLGCFLFFVSRYVPQVKDVYFYTLILGSICFSVLLYFLTSALFKIEEAKLIAKIFNRLLKRGKA